MTMEHVFNIFVYFDKGSAIEYGACSHAIGGDDAEKIAYLRSRIEQDHRAARRYGFSRSFTIEEWRAVSRLGQCLTYFEEAFSCLGAPQEPLVCITPVVDGAPRADTQAGLKPFRGDAVTRVEGWGAVPDYLVHYTSGNTFRFTDLLNDDYFKAIRLLFNASLYVSSAKLLMSCVDTLAFVEFGNVPGNFTKWVGTYVDLAPVGISAEELWEFRNSIVHMTNLASRKIVAGKVSPIMLYVGSPASLPAIDRSLPKPFNLYGLIEAVSSGIGRWGESCNADPDKMVKFIERYDTTISDSRLVWVPHSEAK